MTLNQVAAIAEGIIEHMISPKGWGGYCEVPSATKMGKKYRVYFNAKLYSTSCNCEAGQHSQDCGHRLAVDRHFDSRREALQRDDERTNYLNFCVQLDI